MADTAAPRKPKLVVAVTDHTSATFVRGQLRYMAERGYEVILIASPGPVAERVVTEDGVRGCFIPIEREIRPLADLRALARIVAFMWRERPDTVNAGTPKAGLLVTLAAWLTRVPCRIFTLRGLRVETVSGWRRLALLMSDRLSAGLAQTVVCISPSLRQRAIEAGIVSAEKAVVLGQGSSNGIDLSRFTTSPNRLEAAAAIRARFGIATEPVIGFVGRLVRDKGLPELLDAWRTLRVEHPDAHLLIVGPREAGDSISEAHWRQITDDDHIHVVPEYVSEPAPYYLAMDIFCLPSHREGFGNVLIEAAAMERPVVATLVPGCMDAVADGRTGVLVPSGSPDALVRALNRYLDDAELRRRHAAAGRLRVETEFARERIWQLLHDLYGGAAAEAHRTSRSDCVNPGRRHGSAKN